MFTGRVAVGNKLVDRVGTLDDAVAEAKSLAGIKAEEPIDRLNLPKPKTIFESLFGDTGDDDDAQINPRIGDQLTGTLARQLGAEFGEASQMLAEASQFARLFKRPAVLMLPYRLEIK